VSRRSLGQKASALFSLRLTTVCVARCLGACVVSSIVGLKDEKLLARSVELVVTELGALWGLCLALLYVRGCCL